MSSPQCVHAILQRIVIDNNRLSFELVLEQTEVDNLLHQRDPVPEHVKETGRRFNCKPAPVDLN